MVSETDLVDEEQLAAAYDRALAHEKAGRYDEAADAYRQCIRIDPADHCGAALRLAAIGQGPVPASAGDAYVATLFDQHADTFEDILVGQLRYGVPGLIADRLRMMGLTAFRRGLDLGCGTGLVGEALAGTVDHIVGVDVSEVMVEVTFDKGLYDELYIGEAVSFLEEFEDPEPFDLIVAADVLPYIGDLDPFLDGAAKRLGEGGHLVVSTECPPGTSGIVVARNHRFNHGEDYLRQHMVAHGFVVEAFEPITVRLQEGEPAPGHLVVARRPGG